MSYNWENVFKIYMLSFLLLPILMVCVCGGGGAYNHVYLKNQNCPQLILMHMPIGHRLGFFQLWDSTFLKMDVDYS